MAAVACQTLARPPAAVSDGAVSPRDARPATFWAPTLCEDPPTEERGEGLAGRTSPGQAPSGAHPAANPAVGSPQRLSPLRDLPWLFRRILRAVPGATAVRSLLIVADAAFTALQLWAIHGTVNAVVASVRGGLALVRAPGAVQGGTRLSALLCPDVRERVRVAAGFAIRRGAGAHGAAAVEAFDVVSLTEALAISRTGGRQGARRLTGS